MPISKRPEQLAWVAFGYALVFLAGSIAFAPYTGSRLLHVAIFTFAIATLFSFVAWWHTWLVRRANEEAEQLASARPEDRERELFGDQEAVLQMAADAHRVFDRYFLTTFTVVTGVASAAIAAYLIRSLLGTPDDHGGPAHDLIGVAGMSGFLVVFNLLAGSYFNGLSREPGCRWLRPVAQWLLFAGLIFAGGVAVALIEDITGRNLDTPFAVAALVLITVFGIEMVLNFLLEFYRPRMAGEEEKPLYESRLLGFVTEPGGVAHNVATALDYQFGFKVSETWFYRFVERAVIPIVAVGALALYLLGMVRMTSTQEMAVLETYSLTGPMTREVIGPGLHVKLPYPLQSMRCIDVTKVREVVVGYSTAPKTDAGPGGPGNEGDPTGRVLVWDKEHFKKEVNFVTASQEAVRAGEAEKPAAELGVRNVPVNILNGNLTVQFDIDPAHLTDYAYNYDDPDAMLTNVAQREFVAYLATIDLVDLIGEKMQGAQLEIAKRIAVAVDKLQPALGVRVRYVGFAGLHPPTQVAPAFQNVIAAKERKAATLLDAEAYRYERLAQAQGRSARVVLDSRAYSVQRVQNAMGDNFQFEKQLIAYESAPSIFLLRKRLELLEMRAKGLRKYVVAGDSKEVYILDLGEKLRPDLLQDVDLNAPMK